VRDVILPECSNWSFTNQKEMLNPWIGFFVQSSDDIGSYDVD